MSLLAEAITRLGAVVVAGGGSAAVGRVDVWRTGRLLIAQGRNPETARSATTKKEKEMLALKLLLTVAGVLLLATALGIPLYGLYLRIRYARRKAAAEADLIAPEPIAWRGPVALVLVACLPLLIAASIVVVPSGMAACGQSDSRHAAWHALSRSALRHTAGRECADLRSARSPLHSRHG